MTLEERVAKMEEDGKKTRDLLWWLARERHDALAHLGQMPGVGDGRECSDAICRDAGRLIARYDR